MKTLIIYQSKTGFTQKYAAWLAETLQCDIFDLDRVQVEMLSEYDHIIYGGGLYAVGINGISFIKKNLPLLKDKKITVFATGASPFRNEIVEEVRNKNFTEEEQKAIQFFYLRGGFDFKKLTFVDKILMTMLKMKLKWKKELTADEKGMLQAYRQPVDFTRKKNIHKMVQQITG